jgi:hypothetical protein
MLPLIAVLAGGCISRRDVGDELNRGWYLDENPWARARAKPLYVGRQQLPTRWTFRREDSLIWSTASIVRAADKLKAGADEIEMAISPAHAQMVASVLSDGRRALERLRSIADPDDPPSPEVWAAAVADALIQGEIAARLAAAPPDSGSGHPLGLSAGPVLEMVIGYLNERAGGSLLAGMDPRGVGRLRELVSRVILRLGFAVAGKQPPESLEKDVSAKMARVARPAQLRPWLRVRLREELDNAPPGLGDQQLRSLLRTIVVGAPTTLKTIESLIKQWNRICSLELALRYADDRPLLAITIHVVPGRTVRLAKLHAVQPSIVFRGRSRIVVIPEAPGTDEVALLFEPEAGGGTELRFEGIAYCLVRLMAMPLADGTLREIRVSSAEPAKGRRTLTMAMLMEARGRGDPRRLFVFHDVRDVQIVRDAFEVRMVEMRTSLTVNYLTPTHRYSYARRAGQKLSR